MANSSIKISCPQCSGSLSVAPRLRGKKIACPRCKFKFRLDGNISFGDEASSLIHADLETRDLDRWKESQAEVDAKPHAKPIASEDSLPKGASQTITGSRSGVIEATEASNSSQSIPVQTDWGASHKNYTKQFQRKFNGLSRSQFYDLARRRYQPLSDRDEALQSTGIFLIVVAIITAVLPLFDLKLGEFEAAGFLPAVLSISVAVLGILMTVVAQRNNPFTALGIGLGLLLMFVVAYIGVFDIFGKDSPFRAVAKNEVVHNDVNNDRVLDDVPIVEDMENGQEFAEDAAVEDDENEFEDVPQEPGHVVSGADGRIRVSPPGFRPQPRKRRRKTPKRPRFNDLTQEDLEFEDNLEPDAHRPPKRRENIGVPENTPLQRREDLVEVGSPGKGKRAFNQRLRNLETEQLYNGNPESEEFADKYELILTGKTTSHGVAFLTNEAVIGLDYVKRGRFITDLLPVVDPAYKTSTFRMHKDHFNLAGFRCNFHEDSLVGLQPVYSVGGELHAGYWIGSPIPPGEHGKKITSFGKKIVGFAVFPNAKQNKLVGIGIVIERK